MLHGPHWDPGNRNRKYTLQRKGGGTYRLQLVHEFDQELSTLRRLAVQLHARLHGVEPTCGTDTESNVVLMNVSPRSRRTRIKHAGRTSRNRNSHNPSAVN